MSTDVRLPLADAVRALVHVERRPHAVACAVTVVQAQLPESTPGKRVQGQAWCVVREHRPGSQRIQVNHQSALVLFSK